VVAITGGMATATSMRAAADGIAFPTDIAIELTAFVSLFAATNSDRAVCWLYVSRYGWRA
jgi:hypothetical protein